MAQRHDENYNEQPMTRIGRIQQPSRRYRRLRHPSFTAAIWTANNPLLQRGEIGGEIDTHRIKMGDGVTYWNDLPYASDSIATWGDIQGDISEQTDLQGALDAKQDVLTAGTGISIDSDNVISNSGVRSVATGTTNGTISVNTGGTSAEVAVYGLGSAAYTSSSDYATAAQGAKADNAADKDLSNLTSTGANIGNWSSNVSNCITEIPQDITLTLASGTLTLKAGSKCYLKTDTTIPSVNITSDLTTTQTTNGTYFAIYNGSGLDTVLTTTYDYSSLPNAYSLPLAVITVSSGAIKSIDQVFNGFGFIGSSVFVLPGVKALAPNGRNADGTLKSETCTPAGIRVINNLTSSNGYTIGLKTDGTLTSFYYPREYDQETYPGNNYRCWYKPSENKIYNSETGQGSETQQICATLFYFNPTTYFFNSKKTFHALDYGNTDFIAHQAMPSDRYIDLTLGASDSTYKAPANGWFYLEAVVPTIGYAVRFVATDGTTRKAQARAAAANQFCVVPLYPTYAGETVQVHYDGTLTSPVFKFIYANGAK